jgi:anti-anti-sigma factor
MRRERTGDDAVLWLSGELDMACAGQLETAIGELCADGCVRLVVEMAKLDFMDSTGLRSLLVGRELCQVGGCELLIGTVSPQVARLLEVSGVSGQMAWREPERTDS